MKVLIADDESLSRKTLSFYMQKFGYDVVLAENGLEALHIWRSQSPQIVLTDWNMPEMDGAELCRAIRKEDGDYTYIIFITSRDRTADLVMGFDSGADDYLTKPVLKEELFARIKAAERIFSLRDKDMVIYSLAKLAEARDMETGFHLERIQEFAKVLTEALATKPDIFPEINHKFVDLIHSTSLLHDIGKVGIPDRILLKPGKLTPEEFEVMKAHTIIGYNALNSAYQKNPHAMYLRISAEIARSHHEKWDGSGYPDGLAGNDIPLSARIIAVTDVYDALISKRVYKEAFSLELAGQIMLEGRGKHFDPDILDAFFKVESEIIKIANLYK